MMDTIGCRRAKLAINYGVGDIYNKKASLFATWEEDACEWVL